MHHFSAHAQAQCNESRYKAGRYIGDDQWDSGRENIELRVGPDLLHSIRLKVPDHNCPVYSSLATYSASACVLGRSTPGNGGGSDRTSDNP
ncbi:hypothetical protein VTL71DRAFT_10032 [Oculimacula yallundae]|uniref:Uncharacterized protein n=1 Tax=Oculimacula yallundae TaxID=86028 RepID=A0ABR4BQ45_9HELO